MITPTTPHDPFVPALAVFLVCRQVYEEASAILYKNNTFLFIRNYNGGVAEYELDGDFLTAVAVPWIYKLGSRASLLRKVTIDNGYVCPRRCAPTDEPRRHGYIGKSTRSIDVGPFISTLWRLDIHLEITVQQSTGGYYEFMLLMSFGDDDKRHIPELNTLVQDIYRDKFNFKRYVRTLGSIHAFTVGTYAVVTYVSPRSFVPSRDDYRDLPRIRDIHSLKNYNFIVADPREEAEVLKHEPRELLTLPTPVIGKIMGYVQGYHEDEYTTVKLDDAAGRLESLGPYSIGKLWRHHYGQVILMTRRYKFEVAITSKHGEFPGLCNLDRLLHTKHNFKARPTRDGQDLFGENISGQIRITFNLDEAVTLRDIRYNITQLIEATLPASGAWEVVTVLCCPGNDGEEMSYTSNLAKIRRDALKVWPPYTVGGQRRSCPEIWVNGFNQTVEIRDRDLRVSSKQLAEEKSSVEGENQKSLEEEIEDEDGLGGEKQPDEQPDDEQPDKETQDEETLDDETYEQDQDDECTAEDPCYVCEEPGYPDNRTFCEIFWYLSWQTLQFYRAN
jgi:hypothetical protein